MDVRIEQIAAELGSKGVQLRITEPGGGKALGRLWIGKAKLRWYPGKTSKNYKEASMEQFVAWLDSL